MRPDCDNCHPLKDALHGRRLWVPVFMMAGISFLSGTAGPDLGGWSFTGIDKLGHLVVFGLLGIAWARCLRGDRFRAGRRLAWAVALTALFGMADETHQAFNPLRTFEWGDLAADCVGALVGASGYLRIRKLQALLELEFRRSPRLRSRAAVANSRPDA